MVMSNSIIFDLSKKEKEKKNTVVLIVTRSHLLYVLSPHTKQWPTNLLGGGVIPSQLKI